MLRHLYILGICPGIYPGNLLRFIHGSRIRGPRARNLYHTRVHLGNDRTLVRRDNGRTRVRRDDDRTRVHDHDNDRVRVRDSDRGHRDRDYGVCVRDGDVGLYALSSAQDHGVRVRDGDVAQYARPSAHDHFHMESPG